MSRNDVQTKLVFTEDTIETEALPCDWDGETTEDNEFKIITIDDWEGEHKCPYCGFEWDE